MWPPSGFAIYLQSHDLPTAQHSLIYVSKGEVRYAQILLDLSKMIVQLKNSCCFVFGGYVVSLQRPETWGHEPAGSEPNCLWQTTKQQEKRALIKVAKKDSQPWGHWPRWVSVCVLNKIVA